MTNLTNKQKKNKLIKDYDDLISFKDEDVKRVCLKLHDFVITNNIRFKYVKYNKRNCQDLEITNAINHYLYEIINEKINMLHYDLGHDFDNIEYSVLKKYMESRMKPFTEKIFNQYFRVFEALHEIYVKHCEEENIEIKAERRRIRLNIYMKYEKLFDYVKEHHNYGSLLDCDLTVKEAKKYIMSLTQ